MNCRTGCFCNISAAALLFAAALLSVIDEWKNAHTKVNYMRSSGVLVKQMNLLALSYFLLVFSFALFKKFPRILDYLYLFFCFLLPVEGFSFCSHIRSFIFGKYVARALTGIWSVKSLPRYLFNQRKCFLKYLRFQIECESLFIACMT